MTSPVRPFTALCLACLEPDRAITTRTTTSEITVCGACGQTQIRPILTPKETS